jgi:hypothetical protein
MKDKKDSKTGMTTAQRIAIMKAEMNQMREFNKATSDAYKKYNRERTPISGEPSSGSTLGQNIAKASRNIQSLSDRSRTLGRFRGQEARKARKKSK